VLRRTFWAGLDIPSVPSQIRRRGNRRTGGHLDGGGFVEVGTSLRASEAELAGEGAPEPVAPIGSEIAQQSGAAASEPGVE
jgi:hypothetical protein